MASADVCATGSVSTVVWPQANIRGAGPESTVLDVELGYSATTATRIVFLERPRITGPKDMTDFTDLTRRVGTLETDVKGLLVTASRIDEAMKNVATKSNILFATSTLLLAIVASLLGGYFWVAQVAIKAVLPASGAGG